MKPKVGVIGNGFVGNAVVRGFMLTADLTIHDKNQKETDSIEKTVENSEFIFLCLPTPMVSVEGGQIDLSILNNVIENIEPMVSNTNKIVIIKSTVVPGTTKKLSERYPNINFCFSPEFLTARQAYLDFINAARHIFGGPKSTTEIVKNKLFRPRFPGGHFFETDYTTAELVKYMANLFFVCKIAFCNEFYNIIEAFGGNYDEVKTMVLADGRIENSHMDVPGTDGERGFGGTCFPKDLNAIIHLCKELDIPTDMLNAAWENNKRVRKKWDWAKNKSAVSQRSYNPNHE